MRNFWKNSDTFDRFMAVTMLFFASVLVVLLCALPWLIRADQRERDQLHAQGCEVIDKHTTTSLTPVWIGKTMTMQPRSHTVGTWRCPDGTTFKR